MSFSSFNPKSMAFSELHSEEVFIPQFNPIFASITAPSHAAEPAVHEVVLMMWRCSSSSVPLGKPPMGRRSLVAATSSYEANIFSRDFHKSRSAALKCQSLPWICSRGLSQTQHQVMVYEVVIHEPK